MILTGPCRIGRDAELRYLPSGEPVINLSLAYNYGKRGSDGNKPTQWVDAGLWGKRAEALAPHLLKRTEIWCVIEDVHIETFDKREGGQGHKLAGRIQQLEFIGGRPAGGESDARAPASAPAASGRSRPAPAPAPAGFDDESDDIPF